MRNMRISLIVIIAITCTLITAGNASILYQSDYETANDTVSAVMGNPYTPMSTAISNGWINVRQDSRTTEKSHTGSYSHKLDFTPQQGQWFYFDRYLTQPIYVLPTTVYFSGYLYTPESLGSLVKPVVYIRMSDDKDYAIIPGGFGSGGYVQGVDGWRFYNINLTSEAQTICSNKGLDISQARVVSWGLHVFDTPPGNRLLTYIDDIVIGTDLLQLVIGNPAYDDEDLFLGERMRYQVRKKVFHSLPSGTNLLDNGGFEMGMKHWQVTPYLEKLRADVSWGIDTTGAYDGSKCLHITCQDTSWFATMLMSPTLFWTSGNNYIFSFYAKGTGPSISTNLSSTTVTPGSTWQRYSIPIQTLPGEKALVLSLRGQGTVWLDDLQVELGQTPTAYQSSPSVDVGAYTDSDTNIYSPGTSIPIHCSAFNGTGGTQSALLKYEIKDFFNNIVGSGQYNLSLPAGSVTDTTVSFTPPANGVFWVRAEVSGSGFAKRDDELNIACMQPHYNTSVQQDGFFGGSSWSSYSQEPQLALAEAIGMKSYNPYGPFYYCFAPSDWQMQYQNGVWAAQYAGAADWAMELCNNYYLAPIGMDGGVPTWNGGNTSGVWLMPATVTQPIVDDWSLFAFSAVTRYKDYVHTWEVWAEGIGTASDSSKFITNFLQPFYNSAKAADPNCKVIGPGLFLDSTNTTTQAFLQAGGLQYLDGISLHPYSKTSSPEAAGLDTNLDSVRSMMNQYGGVNKSIWATEAGWQAASTYYTDLDYSENPGYQGTWSEEAQADFIVRANILAKVKGLACYASFTISGGTLYTPSLFGFTYGSCIQPKAVMPAYCNMVHQLDGAQFTQQVTMPAGVRCYLFQKNGQSLATLWSTDQSSITTLEVPTAINTLSGTDIMGNSLQLTASGSNTTIALQGGSPVYLTGTGLSMLGSAMVVNQQSCGPVLWLKADSLIANDGDSIDSWSDSSGNGFSAQTFMGYSTPACNPPVYRTNGIGGRPALEFNGTNRAMSIPYSNRLNTGTFTVFIVAQYANASGFQELYNSAHTDSNNKYYGFYTMSTGSSPTDKLGLIQGNGTLGGGLVHYAWLPSVPSASMPFILTGEYDGATQTVHINGANPVQYSDNAYALNTSSPVFIGVWPLPASNINTQFFNGQLAEIQLYDRALSASEVQSIVTSLKDKYGIQ